MYPGINPEGGDDMAARKITDRRQFKGKVLTLRMSEEEMLKFKLSALELGKKRAVIVRERVADLIGGTPPMAPTVTTPAGGDIGKTEANGTPIDVALTSRGGEP
jgi:hypothetical protein